MAITGIGETESPVALESPLKGLFSDYGINGKQKKMNRDNVARIRLRALNPDKKR